MGEARDEQASFFGMKFQERERERDVRRTHQIHHLPFLPRLKKKILIHFSSFLILPENLNLQVCRNPQFSLKKSARKEGIGNVARRRDIPLEIPKKKKQWKLFRYGENPKIYLPLYTYIIHTQKHGGNFTPNHFLIRSTDRRLDRINRD